MESFSFLLRAEIANLQNNNIGDVSCVDRASLGPGYDAKAPDPLQNEVKQLIAAEQGNLGENQQ